MNDKQLAVAVTVAGTLLLAACSTSGGVSNTPDMRPIGGGIEFLGISLVLCALIAVFGKFIGRK